MSRLLTALALLLLVAASADARGSGLQITPDDLRVMIQKDVGSDRWAINFNLDNGSITGNVFAENAPPIFLWCALVDVSASSIDWDCFAATPCGNSGCSLADWLYIGAVSLPKSFVGQ